MERPWLPILLEYLLSLPQIHLDRRCLQQLASGDPAEQEACYTFMQQRMAIAKDDTIQLVLAACLHDGVCVDPSPDHAMELLREQLLYHNVVHAKCFWGLYLLESPRFQEQDDGLKWLEEAADQYDPVAEYVLAGIYWNERYDQRQEEALELLRSSANRGYIPAQRDLAVHLLFDLDPTDAHSTEEALLWLRHAADCHDAQALRYLGLCYLQGIGVSRDSERALALLHRAVEDGDPGAAYQLGCCYRFGQGVKKDYQEAVRWLKCAVAQGDPEAKYALGVCYLEGLGVEMDLERARELLQAAAEENLTEAMCALGCYYADFELDIASAISWFCQAHYEGDPEGTYLMANYTYTGDDDASDQRAAKWFLDAATRGHDEAQYMLGVCYLNGTGVPPDEKAAYLWLHLAARQGHEEARQLLQSYFAVDLGDDEEEDDGDDLD